MGRLVCDWSVGFDGVDAFLEAPKELMRLHRHVGQWHHVPRTCNCMSTGAHPRAVNPSIIAGIAPDYRRHQSDQQGM
jgi:hypothetical protein